MAKITIQFVGDKSAPSTPGFDPLTQTATVHRATLDAVRMRSKGVQLPPHSEEHGRGILMAIVRDGHDLSSTTPEHPLPATVRSLQPYGGDHGQ